VSFLKRMGFYLKLLLTPTELPDWKSLQEEVTKTASQPQEDGQVLDPQSAEYASVYNSYLLQYLCQLEASAAEEVSKFSSDSYPYQLVSGLISIWDDCFMEHYWSSTRSFWSVFGSAAEDDMKAISVAYEKYKADVLSKGAQYIKESSKLKENSQAILSVMLNKLEFLLNSMPFMGVSLPSGLPLGSPMVVVGVLDWIHTFRDAYGAVSHFWSSCE
jgi:hypothetical protein